MGMTMAQKIIARASGRDHVAPGEYIWGKVDGTGVIGGSALRHLDNLGEVFDPDRVYVVEDHLAPSPSVVAANGTKRMREFVKRNGIKNYFEWGRHGILHELFPDHGYCSPGDFIASVDSHSTSYGCFNVASCPLNEEMPLVLLTGELWLRVPEAIKFNLTGKLPGPESFVVGKDVILRIAGEHGTDVGLYKSVEFDGPGLGSVSMPGRFSIANMGVEIGGKFAIFPCDDLTLEYLDGKMKRPPRPVAPDADADYEAEYTVDMTDMSPYVARPHDPGNSVPIEEVAAEKIPFDQAFIGSCTNARMEDFRMAARILKGNKVHPERRLICTPASQRIWKEAGREGLWDIITEADGMVTNSTCGACLGAHMGVLADEEVCISSTNRNFQGRMGSPKASVYLANPAVVAASAVKGYIADPREFL